MRLSQSNLKEVRALIQRGFKYTSLSELKTVAPAAHEWYLDILSDDTVSFDELSNVTSYTTLEVIEVVYGTEYYDWAVEHGDDEEVA